MRRVQVFALIIATLGMTWSEFGCRPPSATAPSSGATKASETPDATLRWAGRGGGFREWGCGGEFLFGVSVEPSILDVWDWSGERLVKQRELPTGNDLHVAWTQDERCIFSLLRMSRQDPRQIYIVKPDTAETTKCSLPQGWYPRAIQTSGNGTRVGVYLIEDIGEDGPPDADWQHPRMQLGLIDPGASEIDWVATYSGTYTGSGDNVHTVVPSDDGTFIAVAGWENGIAMIDVQARQVAWTHKPYSDCLYYAAFSPDGKAVYAGGMDGTVHVLDTRSGETLGTWQATESGQVVNGHRISCLAVSPDGRWVAAGTGPEGLVFVGSTATNRLVKVLKHGASTVLLVHFSPDSRALATFVPGAIKIWNASRWSQAPASGPATNHGDTRTPPSTAPSSSPSP